MQSQITGAPKIETTYAATLQYQMVYRLQYHAFYDVIPDLTYGALLINVDSNAQPHYAFIPRQVPW